MSLVALKNSFLPNRGYQTLPQDQRRRSNEPQDSQESGSSSDTDDEDVESQTTHVRSRSSSSSTYPAAEDADGDEDRRRECREASVNSGSSNGRGFRISARLLSDATIGLSDGLTVPFALTAGLSAFGETRVVVFGGLAELIAGAISMGLGGYLGAKSEIASYKHLRAAKTDLVTHHPTRTLRTLRDIFAPLLQTGALTSDLYEELTAALAASASSSSSSTASKVKPLNSSSSPPSSSPKDRGSEFAANATNSANLGTSATVTTENASAIDTDDRRDALVDLLLRLAEDCTPPPPPGRALMSAITIAMGYLLGGLVPLAPYFFVSNIATGLRISVAVMAVALFAFGYAKTCLVRVGSGEEGEDTVQLSMPWNWDWSWIRGGEAGRKVKGRRGRRARAERWRARREAARGGVQMVVVGGLAAGAAMGMVVAFDRLMK